MNNKELSLEAVEYCKSPQAVFSLLKQSREKDTMIANLKSIIADYEKQLKEAKAEIEKLNSFGFDE